MRVLICEDDERLRKGLVEILENEGYDTIEAADGDEALKRYQEERPDFICLDIMMPGMSGYDVCRKIRASDEDTPVVFISAKSEEIDKVVGLELGADDYIMKPFGVNEVAARIRAITRRCYRRRKEPEDESFRIGDLEVRPRELRAFRGEEPIELSLREVKILSLLKANAGKLIDRDTMFNECWGMNYLPNSRTLDQHISKLRKKVEIDPKDPKIIETVHGAGYRYSG